MQCYSRRIYAACGSRRLPKIVILANTKLAINDVIIAVEGEPVNNYDELSAAIEGKQADDTVKALCRRYDRDGTYDEFEISFKLMADTSGNY